MYVPNATLWINFFKKKKRDRISQTGGGPTIMPINDISTESDASSSSKPMKVDLVSPVEAATNRAEEQVKRRKRARRKTIKRKRKLSGVQSARKRKNKRQQQRTKTKTRRKNKRKTDIKKKKSRDIFD